MAFVSICNKDLIIHVVSKKIFLILFFESSICLVMTYSIIILQTFLCDTTAHQLPLHLRYNNSYRKLEKIFLENVTFVAFPSCNFECTNREITTT